MGCELTKKKSTQSQERSQLLMSPRFGPAGPIDEFRTGHVDSVRGKIQKTQSTHSSTSTSGGKLIKSEKDGFEMTKDPEELQFEEFEIPETPRGPSKKPKRIKGASSSDTQILVHSRKEKRSHPSWQVPDENFLAHLPQPASFASLTPLILHKRKPQFEFSPVHKGKFLGEQKYGEACTESLRNALFPNQDSSMNTRQSRSLPTSLEKIELIRTSSSTPVKSKDSLRTDRRNSILSNLNCVLDVIPENVDDEKDNPDEYEYSEMDLYF